MQNYFWNIFSQLKYRFIRLLDKNVLPHWEKQGFLLYIELCKETQL